MIESVQQSSPEGRLLFHRLLAFLGSNLSDDGLSPAQILEQRTRRYFEIRKLQLRLLAWRGCPESEREDLVAETFDRVMEKLDELEQQLKSNPELKESGNPAHYVSAVCRLIYRERLRRGPSAELPLEAAGQAAVDVAEPQPDEGDDERQRCLERCLEAQLAASEREFILEYYQGEKGDKIRQRKEMASRLGTTVNCLRIRACRIRQRLQRCISECMRLK
jgi:DNA-directed RNA polymerase specialized sigma24 family protein